MNKLEIKQFQHELLLALKKDFEQVDIPVNLRDAKEENLPMDILTSLHMDYGHGQHEVMGEYYFFPMPGEQAAAHYFSTMINLENDIHKDCLPQLREAVSALNFYVQCGSFVVNPAGTLLGFRFVSLIPMDTTFENALQMMNLNVGHSLELAESQVDGLIRLAQGELDLQDFMRQMPDV